MIFAELEARHSVYRKAIESSFRSLHVEDGKSSHLKIFGPARLGPNQYLPFWNCEGSEFGNKFRCPRTRSNDQYSGLIVPSISSYRDPVIFNSPLNDPFVCLHHR